MELEKVLVELNATLLGDYYTLICPKCGKKEAFLYLDDLYKYQKDKKHKIPIRCNRLNKCGETSFLNDFLDNDKNLDVTLPKPRSSVQMTPEGVRLLKQFIHYAIFSLNCDFKGFDSGIRGISNQTLKNNGVFIYSKCFESLINSPKAKSFFSKKYRIKEYRNRDIFIPILNYEGEAERILLRSSTMKDLKKKEIQVKLQDKAMEIWNISALLSDKKYIFITEGVYDALSIKEVNNSVEAISLPGVKKYKKLITEIKRNIDKCQNKVFVIATDSDSAGRKAAKEMYDALTKLNLKATYFDLKGYKDVNDYLQANRISLSIAVRNIKNRKEN